MSAKDEAEQAKHEAAQAKRQAKGAARSGGRAIRHSASAAADEVRDVAEDAAEKVEGTAEDAVEAVRENAGVIKTIATDLALGGGALAVSAYAALFAYGRFRHAKGYLAGRTAAEAVAS